MKELIENMVEMSGDYDGETLILQSTIAQTEIVQGLTAVKVPSKTLWAGGTMTYTVTITNTTGIPFETPVFIDEIDTRITVVPDSVKIDAVAVPYSYLSNVLRVDLTTIPGDGAVVVTFDVKMV